MDGLLGVAGMMIDSDYGSFPHSLLSISKLMGKQFKSPTIIASAVHESGLSREISGREAQKVANKHLTGRVPITSHHFIRWKWLKTMTTFWFWAITLVVHVNNQLVDLRPCGKTNDKNRFW